MIIVIARLVIKPGSLPHILGPAKICIEETRKEAGCIAYDLFTSITEPETLVFVERWQTRADLTEHSKQPHIAVWREASNPHLISKTIEVVHPDKVETF